METVGTPEQKLIVECGSSSLLKMHGLHGGTLTDLHLLKEAARITQDFLKSTHKDSTIAWPSMPKELIEKIACFLPFDLHADLYDTFWMAFYQGKKSKLDDKAQALSDIIELWRGNYKDEEQKREHTTREEASSEPAASEDSSTSVLLNLCSMLYQTYYFESRNQNYIAPLNQNEDEIWEELSSKEKQLKAGEDGNTNPELVKKELIQIIIKVLNYCNDRKNYIATPKKDFRETFLNKMLTYHMSYENLYYIEDLIELGADPTYDWNYPIKIAAAKNKPDAVYTLFMLPEVQRKLTEAELIELNTALLKNKNHRPYVCDFIEALIEQRKSGGAAVLSNKKQAGIILNTKNKIIKLLQQLLWRP